MTEYRTDGFVRLLIPVALIFAIVAACEAPDPPGDGYLLVQVATPDLSGTPLANLGPISLHSTRVDIVHRADCANQDAENVLTVSNTPATITLNSGALNAPRLVTPQLPVRPGCILQIRFITDTMTVTIGGNVQSAKVPSGPQTGIKVVPVDEAKPFTVEANRTTLVRVDYDPTKQLVFNKGQGIIEKPVVQGVQVDPDFSVGIVLDEVVLTFDPGTTQADITSVVSAAGDTIIRQYPQEFVTVKVPNTALLRDRLQFYVSQPHVRVALPNTLLDLQGPNPFPTGLPNDPLYTPPPANIESVNFDTVHALDAWRVTTGSTDVLAAVVDNGFDLLHADLAPNIWINEAEIPPAIKAKIKNTDHDNHITFADLNHPDNAGICPKSNSPPTDLCDPLDLVDGKGTVGYGFQDGDDNDGNGFKDDIVGWDFAGATTCLNRTQEARPHFMVLASLA